MKVVVTNVSLEPGGAFNYQIGSTVDSPNASNLTDSINGQAPDGTTANVILLAAVCRSAGLTGSSDPAAICATLEGAVIDI